MNAINPVSSVGGAMTAAELMAESEALKKMFGPKADISVGVPLSRYDSANRKPAQVMIWPNGIGSNVDDRRFSADTWAEAIADARAWAVAYIPQQDTALIRRMALAIIDLADDARSCTLSALRCRGFSAEEITERQAAACALALEKCRGGVPFTVELPAERG